MRKGMLSYAAFAACVALLMTKKEYASASQVKRLRGHATAAGRPLAAFLDWEVVFVVVTGTVSAQFLLFGASLGALGGDKPK